MCTPACALSSTGKRALNVARGDKFSGSEREHSAEKKSECYLFVCLFVDTHVFVPDQNNPSSIFPLFCFPSPVFPLMFSPLMFSPSSVFPPSSVFQPSFFNFFSIPVILRFLPHSSLSFSPRTFLSLYYTRIFSLSVFLSVCNAVLYSALPHSYPFQATRMPKRRDNGQSTKHDTGIFTRNYPDIKPGHLTQIHVNTSSTHTP